MFHLSLLFASVSKLHASFRLAWIAFVDGNDDIYSLKFHLYWTCMLCLVTDWKQARNVLNYLTFMWIFQLIASQFAFVHVFLCERNRKSYLDRRTQWQHIDTDIHTEEKKPDVFTPLRIMLAKYYKIEYTQIHIAYRMEMMNMCCYHPHTHWNVVNCVDSVKVPQAAFLHRSMNHLVTI